jgi:hypothetical protein
MAMPRIPDDDDDFMRILREALKKEGGSIQPREALGDIGQRIGPVLRGPFKKWRAERRARKTSAIPPREYTEELKALIRRVTNRKDEQ